MHKGRLLAAVLLLFFSRAALAQEGAPAPKSITHSYSRYEEETLKLVLDSKKTQIDASAEGKTIEGIDVVPLDVIEDRDPAPLFLDKLHATTRPRVIDREVLLRPGDKYQRVLADETARNLRLLPQLSLVIVTAIPGSAPDRVRVLVITKDVWSLRLGFDLKLGGGGLQYLLLEPTETNIAGTQQTVLARFTYYPLSYALGASYRAPRLQGHWLTLALDANVILSRQSGQPEGSFGQATITRPLYSTLTEWSWIATTAWRDEVLRSYVDTLLGGYQPKGFTTIVPYEYRARRIVEQAAVTRSFGWATKNDFSVGAEFNDRLYHTVAEQQAYDPRAVAAFVRDKVPVGDRRVGPFLQWRGYTTNFLRILDFETLGLQEDYRLGHDLWVRLYPVESALGSTRSFFGTYAAAQYTVPLKDGFARASIESTTEAESDRLSDASVGANVRVVTPRLGFGRVVFDAAGLNRYRNHLNRTTFLGGDTRLRGFPSSYLNGKDTVSMNLEYRTRPVEILSCQLGGAAFYDVGDAFDGFDHLDPKHSVGFGVRTLFPQLDRIVFRIDVAFPIHAGPIFTAGAPNPIQPSPVAFFAAFEQAFPVETVGGTVATGGTASNPTLGGALGQ